MVVDREFLAGDNALMVPKTADGRVLFAVPWLGKVILGTNQHPRSDLPIEPEPFAQEVSFILSEAARYLRHAPTRADVRSIWVGLRPLVKPPDDAGDSTKGLSREHTVLVSRSGLVTVTGGKWTTYRAMAEDVLQKCFDKHLLPHGPAGVTLEFRLVGAQGKLPATATSICLPPGAHSYGGRRGRRCCRRWQVRMSGWRRVCPRRWCVSRPDWNIRARSKTCWRGVRGIYLLGQLGPRGAWLRASPRFCAKRPGRTRRQRS